MCSRNLKSENNARTCVLGFSKSENTASETIVGFENPGMIFAAGLSEFEILN